MGELLACPGPQSPRSNNLHSMYKEIPGGKRLDQRTSEDRECKEESENAFMKCGRSSYCTVPAE